MGPTEAEILGLAQQADNPRERAYLLLMLKINSSLEASAAASNAIATRLDGHITEFASHRQAFADHVVEERVLFANGRGAIKVLGWSASAISAVAAALLGVVLWVLLGQIDANGRQTDQISALSDRLRRVETRQEFNERNIANHEQALNGGLRDHK